MSDDPNTTYCVNHPQTPTSLRCNRCEKHICTKCAVLTPTGYRCRDCVRGQQKVFETAQWLDYPIAFVLTAALSYLGSLLAPIMYFLTIFIAPIVGAIIAEAVRYVTRRRRAKSLFILIAAGAAVGGLFPILINAFNLMVLYQSYPPELIAMGSSQLMTLFLWPGVYVVMVTSTVYYRLAGINIRY